MKYNLIIPFEPPYYIMNNLLQSFDIYKWRGKFSLHTARCIRWKLERSDKYEVESKIKPEILSELSNLG